MTIQWNEDYATHERTIDEQHQRLFDFVNNLDRIIDTRGYIEEGRVQRLIDWVDEYIDIHFQYEENCMYVHECAVAGRNLKAHENFLKFFDQFKQDLSDQGPSEELLANLHRTTEDWLTNHIMKIDLELRSCLHTDG